MDHTIRPQHPALRPPASVAPGLAKAAAKPAAAATSAQNAPAQSAPAQSAPGALAKAVASPPPRPTASLFETYDEDLRPGNRHVVEALAAATASSHAETASAATADATTADATTDANHEIGDADPNRWQRHRASDVPELELTFDEFLDIINPLQHIPGISSLYRAATGDEISGSARIMGGTLFGGPVGLVTAAINAITEEVSGQDMGGIALAAVFGGEEADQVLVAAADTGVAPGVPAEPLTTAAGPAQHVTAAALVSESPGNGPAHETAPGQQLTGRAALDAYLDDLRDLGQNGAATPAAVQSATTQSTGAQSPGDAKPPASQRGTIMPVMPGARPGAAATQVAARPAIPAGVIPANAAPQAMMTPSAPDFLSAGGFGGAGSKSLFTDRMLDALDKYQALAKEPPRNDARRVDDSL